MHLPYGNSRSLELSLAIAAPAREVFESLSEPDRITSWLGTRAVGFPRPGGHLEINLGAADLGLEEDRSTLVDAAIRELRPPRLIVLDVCDARTGRPQPMSIELEERGGRTIVNVSQTGFDPNDTTDARYLAIAAAWNFLLANLKSVLESGVDLRATIHGEIFRFEGTSLLRGMRNVRSEARLRAPRAAVFHALTDAVTLASWWPGEFTPPNLSTGTFDASVLWETGRTHRLTGQLTGWSVPEKLRYEWVEETPHGHLEASALFAIIEEGGGSRALILERSAAPAVTWYHSLGGSSPGWDGILSRLARQVDETA